MTNIHTVDISYNCLDGDMVECPKNKGKFITSKYLTFGDYDNSGSVERSNVSYIKENYACNRYEIIIGHYGYTQVYLKNTNINRELVNSLDEYCVICDQYLSEWELLEADRQFLESSIADYPVIYSAIELHLENTDLDPSDIEMSEYFLGLMYHLSDRFCGGESYHFENNDCYFTIRDRHYDRDDCILEVLEYIDDNPLKLQQLAIA